MWRKLQTYQSGEELFGMPQTDYPELGSIRKELNLLQKLYKLYNDVIDRVSSYYDIPWGEVNIEEINNELMEFQNRYVVRLIITVASELLIQENCYGIAMTYLKAILCF
jgi:hypothetical protein